MEFSADDVGYLRSQAGAAALSAVAELELTDATRVADVAAARARFGERAAVLVETVLLRRRAAEKLSGLGCAVSDWLFTDEALQQATAAPVAVHRAGRLAEAAPDAAVHDATS
ncbi:class I SAM-dependent methyltransferase, partial [Mycobacterium intracellulare]